MKSRGVRGGASNGVPPQNKREAPETICVAVREFTEHGVTPAELDRAREQSKANVLMGLEST